MDGPQLSEEFLQLQIGILIWDLSSADEDEDDGLMMLEVEKVGNCKNLQMQN